MKSLISVVKNIGGITRTAKNNRMVSSIIKGTKEEEVILVDISDDLESDAQGLVFDQKTGEVKAFNLGYNTKAKTAEEFRKLYSEKKLVSRPYIQEVIGSFDSKTWSNFVDGYLNSVITSILPIREKRELISSYKYCIPPASFEENATVTRDRATRNLTKAIHFFPMLAGSVMDNDRKVGLDILHSVIPGFSSKPSEKLVRYLGIPNATTGFMKRIGSAPNHYGVKDLYQYVFDGIDVRNISDRKLLNNRVSQLPFAQNEEQYDAMWKAVRSLKSSFLQERSKARLFNNIRNGEWQQNNEVLDQSFSPSLHHYLSSMALFLVLPEYIKKFDEHIENGNSTFSLFSKKKNNFPKKYNHWFVQHVVDDLSLLLEEKFLADSTPKSIGEKIKEFDKRTPAIDANRPIFLERKEEFRCNNYQSYPQWYKLFDDCEIDGFKFCCLCSEAELAEEADQVGHCGSGYGHRCHNGIRHIVSVIAPDGERVTIRLDNSTNGLGQHSISLGEIVTSKIDDFNRHNLSPKMKQMVDNFVRDLSENKIQISSKVGSIDRDYSISDMLGFDQNDEQSCERIFLACKEAGAIPTTAKTLDEFKLEIGLDDYLSKVIPQHIRLSDNQSPPPDIAAKRSERLKDKGAREFIGGMDN